MNKKIFFLIGIIALGMVLPSCINDDEPSNGTSYESTNLPVPGALVDGVRLTSVSSNEFGALESVTFNPNGSISLVVVNGFAYTFEYTSNSELKRIIGRDIQYEEFDKIEIYDISFNSDNFVSKWSAKAVSKDDYESETYTVTYTPGYDKSGQVSKINKKGKTEYDSYEYGYKSFDFDDDIEYLYQDGKLSSYTFQSYGEEGEKDGYVIYKLGYNDMSPKNTYNIAPYMLHMAMGGGRTTLGGDLFAFLGYLGIPSTYLPSSITETHTYEDDEFPITTASYAISNNHLVKSMTINDYGHEYTFELGYSKSHKIIFVKCEQKRRGRVIMV